MSPGGSSYEPRLRLDRRGLILFLEANRAPNKPFDFLAHKTTLANPMDTAQSFKRKGVVPKALFK
jgi:hypothetical protein